MIHKQRHLNKEVAPLGVTASHPRTNEYKHSLIRDGYGSPVGPQGSWSLSSQTFLFLLTIFVKILHKLAVTA